MNKSPEVRIPDDRTTKQRAAAFCRNPECLESSDQEYYEFTAEHSPVVCPKCGACLAPMVGLFALVHLLVRDREGRIVGEGGLKYRLACAPTRAYMATTTNQEAATGDVQAVNCEACLKIAHTQNIKQQGFALTGAGG